MDFDSIIRNHKLSPPEKKSAYTQINATLKIINTQFKKHKLKAKAVLGGSAAKGTMLKNDFDVDIFAQFDYSYKNISDLLEKALKPFKPIRVPGSRDYFQFTKQFNYEIVPVLKISSPKRALNVTDASPLHVKWVKKKANEKLVDQIILTKIFLKAHSLYGAESYIKGFSGHVVDILIIYYNGFLKLLRASQKWKPGQIIDPEKHYTFLNQSKKGPLILIDPVQPDRNAAAALSQKNFEAFIAAAKAFLKKPS
ncbi:MAG: nucleotidyltransferase domain-containing protein, partial [Candidatus Woesearchaeota archaeon]